MAASVASNLLESIWRLKKFSCKVKFTSTKAINITGKISLILGINGCFKRIKNQLKSNSLTIEWVLYKKLLLQKKSPGSNPKLSLNFHTTLLQIFKMNARIT